MSVEVRPARVNTFAPEGKDHLLKVVRKERQGFYDLIDGTTDETWTTPTACTEWEVRDQVGHLVDVTEGYLERFALARAKEPFPEPLGLPGMAGMLDTGSKRFRSSSREQLIARLKEDSTKMFEIFDALTPEQWTGELIPHTYMGPLPTMIYPAFQLITRHRNRDMVHAADRFSSGWHRILGKVEEGEQVPMSEVMEEVGRTLQVPILEQLHERESEHLAVELDRALDVGTDQRQMVQPARAGRRSLRFWFEIRLLQRLALRLVIDLDSGHRPSCSARS